jgi:cyclopropane-fatty-acyl-phospholipid synthase
MNHLATETSRTDDASAAAGQQYGADIPTHRGATPTCRGAASGLERWLGQRFLAAMGSPPVELVLWDGTVLRIGPTDDQLALAIRDRPTFWKLLANPLLQFGDGYSDGTLEVRGDLSDMLAAIYRGLARSHRGKRPTSRIVRAVRRLIGNSRASARQNIHHHYDIGNDFYHLWLDENLVYTCAYFPQPSCSLEEAQQAKMDYICRKVQLAAGDTVVEAGCGWGGLALHMAKRYGAKVRAYNISREQVRFARGRARQEGLQDRVEFIEDDWRNIRGQYDVFLSIGMLEHVRPRNYRRLGRVIDRALHGSGRGLLHSIGRNQPCQMNGWIQRRIFPGAYPPTLDEMAQVFKPYDFSILDVENLRLHYAQTLRHWLSRYESSVDQVRQMFDDRFVHMWRLYLTGSMVAFQEGELQLFQVLFNRARSNHVARTRAYLYADGQAQHAETPRRDEATARG